MVWPRLYFLSCGCFECFCGHFPVISGRLDQFLGTYINKCMRVTWYKGSIKLMLIGLKTDGALASEMCLLQNLDNEISPTKKWSVSHTHSSQPLVMELKKIPNFKIITNQLNTLLMQYTVLLYIILSEMYFCSDQNILYNSFIFHNPFDP